MNRRDLLKLACVPAIAPIVLTIGSSEVQAFELKPNKKYLLRVNVDVDVEDFEQQVAAFKQTMRDFGVQMEVVAGDFDIYELEGR